MAKDSISHSVIRRMPRYYRFLGELERQGMIRISSRELAERMGLTASQIRQDLNCFGGFGQQGYGYNVSELHAQIGKILGVHAGNKTILIGVGNLGKAIAQHIDFEKRGCRLIGIFDSNHALCGKQIAGVTVDPIETLEAFCAVNHPVMAVLCIPKTAAHDLAQQLVKLGIRAFWNFSHYDLRMEHEQIIVENVHLGDSLMTLAYGLQHQGDTQE
ncbi:redox-sensing transcriptional repressor Rex [Ruminococcus sp.]|uniref:redox-sensing transcriptional repressor Rex n=1 Tax=Ruminococcus sp. TaxID=41978 RepID=UPI0025D2F03C|nr:redox-sensing transcriptional repressor Rex [Ruminococcus sp.]MCI5815644.1 redox-sensing transcriptional repressor Rex [Ruminococcus sp.]MDD7556479.1 redox-sensing transcriptional repressor Rex [Ruminococcus sp.]MDY4963119.1 redox-sensing transcriptional repressor Rex [Ruminococcus callidus]